MNVNELKLGNLVKTSVGCFSVYAISSPMPNKDERFNNKTVITLWCDGLFDVTEDMIEPVPLTKNLISINGFEKSKKKFVPEIALYEKRIGDFVVFLCKWDDGVWYAHVDDDRRMTVGGCYVKYVHELQNICSLCGIEKVFKSC